MVKGIDPILPRPAGPGGVEPTRPESPSAAKGPGSADKNFGAYLKEALGEVNDLQIDADSAIEDLAAGRTEDISRVMLAVAKADLAFETMMQIRNKLLDAYQEIMRMNT
ncbi:MAG: flagellar hook-basal body complex protein FliE [Planctomycetes bacterium]|nr:flagellar hook-basal body complex protein FliE [Planctomycetota bacterium]